MYRCYHTCVHRYVFNTHGCVYTRVLSQITRQHLLLWLVIFAWATLARLEALVPVTSKSKLRKLGHLGRPLFSFF